MTTMWLRYFTFFGESSLQFEVHPWGERFLLPLETGFFKHPLQWAELMDSLRLLLPQFPPHARWLPPRGSRELGRSLGFPVLIDPFMSISHIDHALDRHDPIVKSPLGQLDLREIGGLPKP